MTRSADNPVSTHFSCRPLKSDLYFPSCAPYYQKASPIRRGLAGEEPLLFKSLTFAGLSIKSSHFWTRRRRRLLNVLTTGDRRTTRHIKGYGQGCGRDYHSFSPCQPRQPAESLCAQGFQPITIKILHRYYQKFSPPQALKPSSGKAFRQSIKSSHPTQPSEVLTLRYQKFSPFVILDY